jgi:formylglycine-generating enzyme required for sulfatase activity
VPKESTQTPTSHQYNVRGNALHVARTFRTYNPEERRAFKKKINDLDSDELLSSEVATQARNVIERNQPQLDKDYFTLLQQLCDGEISLGTFTQKWLEVKPPAEKQAPAEVVERKPDRVILPKHYVEALNGVPLEMVLVPAGKFMMGGDKFDDEKPIHEVSVPSFYIGKFQITQKQWQAVMGTTIQQQRDKASKAWPLRGEGADYPMYYVSWHEAQAFCEKLRTLSGKAYRLPSEAEWEYACRAGTTGDYAGKLEEMGWYGNNSGRTVIDALAIWREVNQEWTKYDERLTQNGNKTHLVGQKQPNDFGLFDMHGNVWEWCEDVWHGNYDKAPTNGSAWTDGGNSDSRVVRGGAWSYYVN